MSTKNDGYASSIKSTLSNELLSRKEVAELLGISLVSVWKFSRRGVLHPYRVGGKKIYFKKSEVLASLKPVYPSKLNSNVGLH